MTGRVSKFTYGVPYGIIYQPSDPEHTRREHKIYVDAAGDRRIDGRFENMLSRVCYLPPFIILLDNPVVFQGTKVLEDREVKFSLCYLTEGTPQQHAASSVLKYTGMSRIPEWTDVNEGSVFNFYNIVRGTQAKQTSSRRCALYELISPRLHIRHSTGTLARHTISGTSM